mmetsp:Transcript_20545/g.48211  ORF Transcript_20545/g.48211 Transcript_20545/m.48211 type:complete len:111 (-) Transcript_20545:135-467(-)
MADDDLRADSSTASLRKYSDIPAHNVIPVYLQAEQGCSSSSRSSRRRSYSVSKDDSCWWSRVTGADADADDDADETDNDGGWNALAKYDKQHTTIVVETKKLADIIIFGL